MAVDIAAGLVSEVLSSLLARRTSPGDARVILNAADYHEHRESVASALVATEPFALRTFLHGDGSAVGDESLGEEPSVGESALALADAFLDQMVHAGNGVVAKLDIEEATRLGRLAADQVIAGARWSQLVGDRIDTTSASELLGVSRQALAKRQLSGSVLGLAGHGTTWYPTWQFDTESRAIRPEVRDIIGAFRDVVGDQVDPFLIAAWASRPQPEDLDGSSPAGWLVAGGDLDQLRAAARRAAERLGS